MSGSSSDTQSGQPRDPGVGQPPRDLFATSDIRFVMVEIAKLQVEHGHVKDGLGETRSDVKDMRDRLGRLEEQVRHLPGKGFIVIVVTTALVILGGMTTLAPKLWSLSGSAPVIVAPR